MGRLPMTHRASLASLKKLSSESNNGGREDCLHIKARLFMASGAFFCHVVRILLSEFDEDPNKPSLGINERSCVIGMFVIIMSAEHDCDIGFVFMIGFHDFSCLETVSLPQMDVSEAISLCWRKMDLHT